MIRLGYEIGSGRAVDIPGDRHVAISGQTQRSGKTTTLEALIHRASHRQDGTETKRRAVAFVTKRAEGSFRSARPIAPYFRDSADWQFVSSILEAMLGERMKFERAWIIDACRGAEGLAGVLANVKRRLHGVSHTSERGKTTWKIKPAQGLNRSILTQLEAYLELVIPQIQRLPYTKTLALAPGLNVMDLSDYSTELQQLVIRSVLEWVYEREHDTVVVIPEAWEFIPQNRRSPVLLAAEELIRKGAAAGNFVWLDSQDIAGVHKNVLRSVGVWILGVQRELNEVKRTLGYVQGAGKIKPEQVMALGKGEFFVAYDQTVAKVYVQPFWISDAHAAAIARGDESVESAEKIWREMRSKATGRAAHRASRTAADMQQTDSSPNRGNAGVPEPSISRANATPPYPQLLQILDQEKPCNDEAMQESEAPVPEPGSELCDNLPTAERYGDNPGRSAMGGSGGECGAGAEESEGDEMYKERAEQAEAEIARLRGEVARLHNTICSSLDSGLLPDPTSVLDWEPASRIDPGSIDRLPEVPQAVVIDRFTDAGYELLKKRLLADPGVLAALDAQRPLLRVSVTRRELPIDGDSASGRLGILVSEGFFARPQPPAAILAEFKRRGWFTKKYGVAHLNKPLLQISRLGFLTLEADGYRMAPGAKVEIERQ